MTRAKRDPSAESQRQWPECLGWIPTALHGIRTIAVIVHVVHNL